MTLLYYVRLVKKHLSVRPPDFVVGDHDSPYLHRWWLIPRNRHFNIYLHHFLRSDEDRALHDHPWWSISLLIRGRYWEEVPCPRHSWHRAKRYFPHLSIIWRGTSYIHRVVLGPGETAWTLFITGPVVREWGFHCPQGWVHWKDFVKVRPGGNSTGVGCGEQS